MGKYMRTGGFIIRALYCVSMADAKRSDVSGVVGEPSDFTTITFGSAYKNYEIDIWKGKEHDSREEVLQYIADNCINGLDGVFGRGSITVESAETESERIAEQQLERLDSLYAEYGDSVTRADIEEIIKDTTDSL